ncbi:MAG TPA: helix-turn-helix transcriptional regulator [Candidatus Paceibacterota bacterium]|nr:helix-turn-helix transcriptional regulator [Candidatus Paceibacterota bacterium]
MKITKSNGTYSSHLALGEICLPPEVEWAPRMTGWIMCQITSGISYWLHPKVSHELVAGTVIVFAPNTAGSIRASQLGNAQLHFFTIEPDRLTGLISMVERMFLDLATSRETLSTQILPPDHPIAARMKELCANQDRTGSLRRLQLLQLYIEVFQPGLTQEIAKADPVASLKDRLRDYLNQTTATELLDVNLSDLGKAMHCTRRHLSRTFHEVVGMPFREMRTELRLLRARELLSTTNLKIVDVALESGFQSLSLFNLMFKRRFGTSPGLWRKNQTPKESSRTRRKVSLGIVRASAECLAGNA